MDDQQIIDAINKSPLQEEDKIYWVELLDRMSLEQKQRFYHTVVVKTDVKRAANEIKSALDIINKALEEEQAPSDATGDSTGDPSSVVQDIMEQTDVADHIDEVDLNDTELIKKRQQEVEVQLKKLREEIAQISHDVSGQKPPSFQ